MNNQAIKSGLIIGAIGSILSLLIYIVDASLFAVWWLMIIIGLINLSLITFFAIKNRNEKGGFLSFKEAYVYSITAVVVLVLISSITNYFLFNIIDPKLPQIIAEASVENTEIMMLKFGASEADIEKSLKNAYKDTIEQFTPLGIVKGIGIRVLINLVVCLILAVIIKKNKPEESI